MIAETLSRTHAALAGLGLPSFEVIVVDDGSTDSTRSCCAGIASQLPEIRVLAHPANRGYGAALRTGFQAAQCEAIFLMDSDGQFDPADLRLLLNHWSPTSVVCGCRAERSDPLIRRLNNRAFFWLVVAAFGATARDVNCGFKLFPRALGQELRADGALVSTELLMRSRVGGLRIIDAAVPHYPRLTGKPTGARPSVILRAFAELWSLRRELHQAGPPAAPAPPAPEAAAGAVAPTAKTA